MSNDISTDSIVEYKIPYPNEIGLTFTVIEIDHKTNWCLLLANVNMTIKPTETANISDLIISNT